MVWLFLLAIPIACISWTVTHEEVFREPREYCVRKSEGHPSLVCRKFYYLFTCEYCFSHYVTVVFLLITRYKLLYDDWRGYLISLFSLVFVANFYIGAFGKVKLGVKKERAEIQAIENEVMAAEPRIHKPAAQGEDVFKCGWKPLHLCRGTHVESFSPSQRTDWHGPRDQL